MKDFEHYLLVTSLTRPLVTHSASEYKRFFIEARAYREKLGRTATYSETQNFIKGKPGREVAASILEDTLEESVAMAFIKAFKLAEKEPEKLQYLSNSQALVSFADITEGFLLAIARNIYRQNPSLMNLKASDKEKLQRVCSNKHPALLEKVVDKEIHKLSHQPLKELLRLLREAWNVDPSNQPIAEIEELIQRRHLVVHRGGRLTQDYLSRTPKKLRPNIQIGELAPIEDQYLASGIENVAGLLNFILVTWNEMSAWSATQRAIEVIQE